VIDDTDLNARKIAYIDHVRGMHKGKRLAGFVGCLVGVLIMAAGRFSAQVPDWAVWVGLAVIAVSWSLFAYVIYTRTIWARTHPFDSWTPA
jgi:hypothetical protein